MYSLLYIILLLLVLVVVLRIHLLRPLSSFRQMVDSLLTQIIEGYSVVLVNKTRLFVH